MDCPTLKDTVVLLHSCRRRYAVFIVEVNIVRVVLSDLSKMTGYFRAIFHILRITLIAPSLITTHSRLQEKRFEFNRT